jgi:phospholipase/carboxylesterase
LLETIEVETQPNPTAAIIWLHGLGADGHDFEPVVPEIVLPSERAWRFVFPNAPVRPVTLNNGMRMRAWYDIKSLDRGTVEDLAGFADTAAHVGALIEREAARGIPAHRVVLAGFSQGGAVSLYMLGRYAHGLAGVMALSCYLPAARTLGAERSAANNKTPVFMAHGQFDPVIAVSAGQQSRDALKSLGYAVDWHEYPMAHSVCPEEISDIRRFLFKVLP